MRLVICATKDRAADSFGRPFFVNTTGVAIRSFTDEVNRAADDNQLYAHPDDFDLYELGVYVDDNASFELLSEPRLLVLGKQVKTA